MQKHFVRQWAPYFTTTVRLILEKGIGHLLGGEQGFRRGAIGKDSLHNNGDERWLDQIARSNVTA